MLANLVVTVDGKPVPTDGEDYIRAGATIHVLGALWHLPGEQCKLTIDFYSFEVARWPCGNMPAPGYVKSAAIPVIYNVPSPVSYTFEVPKNCQIRPSRLLEVKLTHGANPEEAGSMLHTVGS